MIEIITYGIHCPKCNSKIKGKILKDTSAECDILICPKCFFIIRIGGNMATLHEDTVMEEVNYVINLRNHKLITEEETTKRLNQIREQEGLPPLSSYDYLPLIAAVNFLRNS
jgi:hypothetical protein